MPFILGVGMLMTGLGFGWWVYWSDRFARNLKFLILGVLLLYAAAGFSISLTAFVVWAGDEIARLNAELEAARIDGG